MKQGLGTQPKTKKDHGNKSRGGYVGWVNFSGVPGTGSAAASAAAVYLGYRDVVMNQSPSTELNQQSWPAGDRIRPSRCPTPPPNPSRSQHS